VKVVEANKKCSVKLEEARTVLGRFKLVLEGMVVRGRERLERLKSAKERREQQKNMIVSRTMQYGNSPIKGIRR